MPLILAGEPAKQLAGLLGSRKPIATSKRGHPRTTPDEFGLSFPVEAVLARRRSVRDFWADPLPLTQLDAILSAAYAAERQEWSPEVHGRLGFRILTSAFRVAGLPEGMYATDPGDCGSYTALPATSWLPALRQQYTKAPVLLHVCGDLGAACSTGDGSGYGALLVRAGTLGYAAWLAAISEGLAGSVYGGASPRVTQAARRIDGRLCHLFTVAVGAAATATEDHGGPE